MTPKSLLHKIYTSQLVGNLFITFCILGILICICFIFEVEASIITWVLTRKFVIVQSIGSLATATAIIISLIDFKRRWEFEETKFNFESDPNILPLPILVNGKDNPINTTNFKFNIKNTGKGIASKIEIYICQDDSFHIDKTIQDVCYNLSATEPVNISQISLSHLVDSQEQENKIQNIDWSKDFYIKIISKSNYSKNRIFTDTHKAEIRESPPNHFYIHNIVTIYLSPR